MKLMMMLKRMWKLHKLPLVVVVLILLGVLIVVGRVQHAHTRVVRIALINSLTGPSLDFGKDARNGVFLALNELEERSREDADKIHYEVIEFDDQSLTETIPKIMAEVKARNVDFALGPLTSGRGIKALESLAGGEFLLIGPVLAASALRNIEDNFVTLYPSIQDVARHLGTALRHRPAHRMSKATQLAIYSDKNNVSYAMEFSNAFLDALGMKLEDVALIDHFDEKQTPPHQPFLQRLQQSSATHLLIIASGMDAAIIAQLAKRVRPELQLYFSSWSITNNFISTGGMALSGALFAAPFNPSSQSLQYQKFLKSYRTQFSSEPSLYVAQFYFEAILLIDHLIGPSRQWDRSRLKRLLVNGTTFTGIVSPIHLNRSGDAVREIGVYTIEQGTILPMR